MDNCAWGVKYTFVWTSRNFFHSKNCRTPWVSHPTSGHYFEYCEKPIKGIKNREKICYNENIFNETDACRPSIPANIMAPKLQVKQIAPTVRVWTDSGSGADKDGSFWTASEIQLQNDFKLLGEILCIGSYSNACHSMILVQDSKESILVGGLCKWPYPILNVG